MRTFLQGADSQARSEFLNAFQQRGEIGIADVLKFVQSHFDAAAKVIVITVSGPATIQQRLDGLDELNSTFLAPFKDWFVQASRLIGVPVEELETEARLRLVGRLEEWKAQAARLALEGQRGRNRTEPGVDRLQAPEAIAVSGAATRSGEGRGRAGRPSRLKDVLPRKVVSWAEIEIRFTSDERVQVYRAGQSAETLNYSELGLEDRRSGKPNKTWAVLMEFAKRGDNTIPPPNRAGTEWVAEAKRIGRLRQVLMNYFGLSDDPLVYNAGGGYSARLAIRYARAADS